MDYARWVRPGTARRHDFPNDPTTGLNKNEPALVGRLWDLGVAANHALEAHDLGCDAHRTVTTHGHHLLYPARCE
jgi:hypothetical protein